MKSIHFFFIFVSLILAMGCSNLRALAAQKEGVDNTPTAETIEAREKAIQLLTDLTQLANIAQTHEDWILREAATRKLKNEETLLSIAQSDEKTMVRCAAIDVIQNQDHLALIATSNDHWPARLHAVNKLTNRDVLTQISQIDKDPDVRQAATARLKAL